MSRSSRGSQVALVGKDTAGLDQNVVLVSQPSQHIPGFIFGNSLCRRCGCPPNPLGCTCSEPVHIPVYPMSAEGSREADSVLICGAGPSLHDVAGVAADYTEVWAANSALMWMTERGVRVTHGVAIDPSTHMFGKVWQDPPDVQYLLATTVNPGLTDHLWQHGRAMTFFHSLRGLDSDETTLYGVLYPKTVLTGHGLNVCNRALDLAGWLGFGRIGLIGADCALSPDGTMYADGRGVYSDDWGVVGEFDERKWHTKADMLMSAVEFVRHRNRLGADRVTFIGDTLPKALQDKSEEFLKRCIDWAPNE